MTPSALAGPGVSRPTAATRSRATPASARARSIASTMAVIAASGPSVTRLGTSSMRSTRKPPRRRGRWRSSSSRRCRSRRRRSRWQATWAQYRARRQSSTGSSHAVAPKFSARCWTPVPSDAPCQCSSSGRRQDDVAGLDRLDAAVPRADAADALGHEQHLPVRVRVPMGAHAGREADEQRRSLRRFDRPVVASRDGTAERVGGERTLGGVGGAGDLHRISLALRPGILPPWSVMPRKAFS